jgi:hypothetical protein
MRACTSTILSKKEPSFNRDGSFYFQFLQIFHMFCMKISQGIVIIVTMAN